MNVYRVPLHDGFTVQTDCTSFANFLQQMYSARLGPERRWQRGKSKVKVTVLRHNMQDTQARRSPAEDSTPILVQRDPVLTEFQRIGFRRRSPANGVIRTVIPESRTVVEYHGPELPVAVQSPCYGEPSDMISTYKQDDAFRTVRHVLYAHLLRHGYVWCHGACVAGERGALLIVGASRAGKTSTMTHLLRSGQYAFMSNSRSFIHRASGGQVQVDAFPELVQLRQGFLMDNPDVRAKLGVHEPAKLANAWQAPESTKLPVFCTDFAHALGVPQRYRAEVRGLVIPALDRGPSDAPRSLPGDRVRAIIDENLLVEQYMKEYTWYEGAELVQPGVSHAEKAAIGQSLALLPGYVSYLDLDANIVVTGATA
jgi:hypothetical protein